MAERGRGRRGRRERARRRGRRRGYCRSSRCCRCRRRRSPLRGLCRLGPLLLARLERVQPRRQRVRVGEQRPLERGVRAGEAGGRRSRFLLLVVAAAAVFASVVSAFEQRQRGTVADADHAQNLPVRVQRRQRGPEHDHGSRSFRSFSSSSFFDLWDRHLWRQVSQPQLAALPGIRTEWALGVAGAVEGAQGLGLDRGVAGYEGRVGREGVRRDGADGDDDLFFFKRVEVEVEVEG